MGIKLKLVKCKNCGKSYTTGLSYFGENDKEMVCTAKCAFDYRKFLRENDKN